MRNSFRKLVSSLILWSDTDNGSREYFPPTQEDLTESSDA